MKKFAEILHPFTNAIHCPTKPNFRKLHVSAMSKAPEHANCFGQPLLQKFIDIPIKTPCSSRSKITQFFFVCLGKRGAPRPAVVQPAWAPSTLFAGHKNTFSSHPKNEESFLFSQTSSPTVPSAQVYLFRAKQLTQPFLFVNVTTKLKHSTEFVYGYKYLIVHVAFLQVFDDRGLFDLREKHHVLHATRLHRLTLPVVLQGGKQHKTPTGIFGNLKKKGKKEHGI